MPGVGGLAAATAVALVAGQVAASAHPTGGLDGSAREDALKGHDYDGVVDEVSPGGVPMEAMSDVRCEDGMAGIFPCHKVDLASFTPLPDLEATFINDTWGWEDAATGMELAIVGTFEGTAFVDTGDFGNIWGDVRVFADTAYIVTESFDISTYDPVAGYLEGNGVQIVDLTQFRGVTGPIDVVEEDRIDDFSQSHNVSVNVDTGHMYVVGAVYSVRNECAVEPPANFPVGTGTGGAMIYDLDADPHAPTLVGCLNEDGYTHDITCVVYDGPDADHRGKEICIGSNEDTVTLYDATDPTDTELIAKLPYDSSAYTHQGWLSEDHSYFFLGDELDETVQERTTYIWDFTDLDAAELIGVHSDGNSSIDHNMFIKDGLLHQSNYTSGLWIYDTWKADQGRVTMRGYFDVFPANDDTVFAGTWGNYPYFDDGKVVVTSSDEGLFVLESRAKSSSTPSRQAVKPNR